MAIIKPFKALRPQPHLANKVASRPYDVLNTEEAKTEAKENPLSFLHITKAEIDFPNGIDIHSQAVYDKAKENLQQFIEHGTLSKEGKPCYYVYQLVMNGRSQTGLVCVSSVDDYFNNIIKKHEFTRPEKEKDRIDHMKTIGAQTGNVFMAYRRRPGLEESGSVNHFDSRYLGAIKRDINCPERDTAQRPATHAHRRDPFVSDGGAAVEIGGL